MKKNHWGISDKGGAKRARIKYNFFQTAQKMPKTPGPGNKAGKVFQVGTRAPFHRGGLAQGNEQETPKGGRPKIRVSEEVKNPQSQIVLGCNGLDVKVVP